MYQPTLNGVLTVAFLPPSLRNKRWSKWCDFNDQKSIRNFPEGKKTEKVVLCIAWKDLRCVDLSRYLKVDSEYPVLGLCQTAQHSNNEMFKMLNSETPHDTNIKQYGRPKFRLVPAKCDIMSEHFRKFWISFGCN